MRRVVYTAIIAQYDVPPRLLPSAIDPDCDYICFCDENVELDYPWQLRGIERLHSGAAVTNRWVKFCAHKLLTGYDHALYIDGNVDLLRFPSDAFALLDRFSCAFVAHPRRRSVREEMVACILAGKLTLCDSLALAASQSRAGFHDHSGLTANRLFARCLLDSRANAMFEAVFDNFLRGPPRDQLHLQFELRHSGVPHVVLPSCWAHDTFEVRPHKGINQAHGRLVRALRRLLLGPVLTAQLAFFSCFNHKENLRRD